MEALVLVGTPLNPHGSFLPELEPMVEHGMTPPETMRPATTVAAQALGLGGETGRVAAGYSADLLALAGDPAEQIGALGDLRLMLARGGIIGSP
jgi:imidazolonepropionase-like amidohydrolase